MTPFAMLKITLTNLFKKPATLMYPVKPREFYKNTRGHLKNDIDKCIFCGICQKKCPSNALAVSKNDRTWQVDRMKCIVCSHCVDACPKKSLSMENAYFNAVFGGEKESRFELMKGAPLPPKAPANPAATGSATACGEPEKK